MSKNSARVVDFCVINFFAASVKWNLLTTCYHRSRAFFYLFPGPHKKILSLHFQNKYFLVSFVRH